MKLTADWRHLVYFNYEVDAAALTPFVPAGLELDSYNGDHYLSVVAFIVTNLRVMGFSLPDHQSYVQVQSQIYLRKKTPTEWKRGTLALRRIVPQPLTKKISRVLGEDAVTNAPTKYDIHFEDGSVDHMGRPISDEVAKYGWCWQDRWQGLTLKATGLPAPLGFGPLEQFIANRGYRFLPGRQIRVEHPEWFYWDNSRAELAAEPESLGLANFADLLARPPASAFLVKGSRVEMSLPSRY